MPVPENVTTKDTQASSNHIKAEDSKLDAKWKLTIADVDMRLMEQEGNKPPRNKFILSFQGKEKNLVLNMTNQNFIEARLGPKPNQWVGADIVLHRTTTTYAGNIVPAFR